MLLPPLLIALYTVHLQNAPPLLYAQCLQDVLASESQLVVLECRVKGVPSPQVDWSRDGALLEDSPEFRILQKSELCCRDHRKSSVSSVCCVFTLQTRLLHFVSPLNNSVLKGQF